MTTPAASSAIASTPSSTTSTTTATTNTNKVVVNNDQSLNQNHKLVHNPKNSTNSDTNNNSNAANLPKNSYQARNRQPRHNHRQQPFADASSLSMQAFNQQNCMYHPNLPLPFVVPQPYASGCPIPSMSPLYSNPSNFLPFYSNMHLSSSGEKEIVNLFIPNSTVGAIIGKSGNAIKAMIISSGATIKVISQPLPQNSAQQSSIIKSDADNLKLESSNNIDISNNNDDLKKETSASQAKSKVEESETKHEVQSESDLSEKVKSTSLGNEKIDNSTLTSSSNQAELDKSPATDTAIIHNQHQNQQQQLNGRINSGDNIDSRSHTRKVTITGTPESQYSAQLMIYRKVSQEVCKSNVSLMVEIQVPSLLVGKIIGKGGGTVKLIQNQTNTLIRLPGEKPAANSDLKNSETPLQITGEFENSQLAQRQIRRLVRQWQNANTTA